MLKALFLVFILLLSSPDRCRCMLKRKGDYASPDEDPAKRLQLNIVNLAVSNEVSFSRTDSLLRDAVAAGVRGARKFLGKTAKTPRERF